jgi:Rps23 Pro-64 3,4-dihydroxylase Tpa1-like proline 4-hydroxylase
MDRSEIGDVIAGRLREARDELKNQFESAGRVPSCVVDDLLPQTLAKRIHAAFPPEGRMKFKNTIRERKYISAQMDAHDPILEEVVFAFQQAAVVDAVASITDVVELEPDTHLYAGGISAMRQGNYLRPHLDNSHDRNQEKYRALNLLYYVTPDWHVDFGGNLELWDAGPRGSPRTIESRFNRLVIMATNRTSWHSVSPVKADNSRCCVSNYYFTPVSPERSAYFHATSYRGRPGEIVEDLVMQADAVLRTAILKTTGTRIYKNPHVYNKSNGGEQSPE